MTARFATPSQGSLNSTRDKGNGNKPISPPPQQQPEDPLLGRIDLTDFTPEGDPDPSDPGEDGLVAEISASVYIANKLFTISSGGSNLVTLTDWKDSSNPEVVQQLDLSGFFTTSVASFGNLIAIAATPDNYDATGIPTPESQIRFYSLNPSGKLTEVGVVNSGFLTDGMRFSADGRQLYIANEGQPDADYTVDPVGSVSIINLSGQGGNINFEETEILFPDLDAEVNLQGSGIRFSGKTGIPTSFAQDAEPEYVAAAGGYLFVTLQENNTVARIDLDTNSVEAYIGLGWVDYSQVSVDLDDRDGPPANGLTYSTMFNPLADQNVVGLRMADGIAAWEQGEDVYFITANEGDARGYGTYNDERRDGSSGYITVPNRHNLIVNGNSTSEALVLSNAIGDADPSNDFSFESGTRDGTPVSFGSRSLTIFDGLTGELVWDSWMTDSIKGQDGVTKDYNTSLENIAEFVGIRDDGRSDNKGVEPESVTVLEYNNRRYAVGSLERTTAGDKTADPNVIDPVTQGGLLVVYDITDVNNVDFVTYQQVSRSPEGLEVIGASQSPTGRLLLGVSSEFDSNSVELLDFGALLGNGNRDAYLTSTFANPLTYQTL